MKELAAVLALLTSITAVLAFAYGWAWNIITLSGLDTFGGEAVVRVVGIFIPLVGAVAGYF